LILGLLELGRPRRPVRDWLVVLDTLALGVAGSLPAWLFLLRPAVMSLNLSSVGRVFAMASWVCVVTVLAATARVVLVWRTNMALNLLAAGAAAFVAGDFVYGRNLITGTWHLVVLIDLGFGSFVVLCGAAALTNSMLMLESDDGPALHLGYRHIVIVAFALLIPPTVLLVEAVPGPVTTGVAIGLVAATVAAIVVVRLVLGVRTSRRRVRRERAMRVAFRDLVEATTNTEVCDGLQIALTAMLPVRSDGDVHLRPRNSASLEPTGPEVESLAVPVAGSTLPAGSSSSLDLVITAPQEYLPELKPTLLVLADQAVAALDRIELTRRLRTEEKERYFRTLVLTSNDATLISRDGRIDYATPSARTIFGREVQGERFDDVVRRASDGDAAHDRSWSTDDNGAEGYVVHPDGERIAVLVHRRDLTNDPTVNGVVATVRDVSAERRLQADLAYRATHDALTGLANAKAFGDELRGEAARRRERRISAPAGMAALFVDLDDFKDVNDTYGHQVGDQLLSEVARRFSDCLRDGDIAARLGGDEFAALLRGLSGEAAAQAIAQRIVDALAQPVRIGGIPLNGEASVGLAYAPTGADVEALIRNADTALYSAKAHGKGRWRQYHDGMVNPARHHIDARRRVEEALDNGWLAVHYQPIVELATGTPVGFEALVRLNDSRGNMAPAELIAVAEQTGLIERVGDFVLHQH
jgi:diguanylate cyclase (GGDEF)-like protein/PAS domain S-box-containing protein